PSGADALVGRPLAEVERHYMQRALERTGGNREEAAKLLGIGERTLYRGIPDWKLEERIPHALARGNGYPEGGAAQLGLEPAALERKLKKLGATQKED